MFSLPPRLEATSREMPRRLNAMSRKNATAMPDTRRKTRHALERPSCDARRRTPEGATSDTERNATRMKRMMGTVLIAGFLVVAADLEAAERRFVRVKSMDGPKAKIALTTGPLLLAANDSGSPPPAPANNPVPQAPANDTKVPQAPANDAVTEASADDADLGAPANPAPQAPAGVPMPQAPVNDAVPQAPASDAVFLPPAPLPPVASPGSPSVVPLPEAGPPGPALSGPTQFSPALSGPVLPVVPGSVAAGSPPLQVCPGACFVSASEVHRSPAHRAVCRPDDCGRSRSPRSA